MLVLPNFVGDFDPGPRRILPEFGDMCSGSVACPCLHTETSAGSWPQQFSTLAAGDAPFRMTRGSDVFLPKNCCPPPPPVALGTTVGVCLFESDLVCLVLKGTDMVPVCRRRGVCFFASSELRT